MKNIDSYGHVRGESIYLDDIPTLAGTLYGVVFDSPKAAGEIVAVDYSKALEMEGVVAILTHKDITGVNQIGGIFPDEPLFAEDEVHFSGMPIALIVAETELIGRKAKKAIQIKIKEHTPIVDPREAREKDSLIFPPRTFKMGDSAAAFADCKYVFEGEADTNGQEHLYIEMQGAYAVPKENDCLTVYSSTQGPTAVQRTTANVLGIPMHKVEVDVTRLGGGFGGKEDQATPWAVMTALAAQHLKQPVKLNLHRMDDMRMTGKRHPYRSDYKIGLDENYKIIAYEATYHQNAGAAADLSPAVMERTLFHATNSYFIPNVRVTAYSCKTNLPPNTAFRGFGGPQGMFVMESAITHAAEAIGISATDIQRANLLQEKDEFPYGQIAEQVQAGKSWDRAANAFDLEQAQQEVEAYNASNRYHKKGIAAMPICFGISFTKTNMNHARALVHIYQDGSVGISTAAVEMGQGVNTKMVQVAAATLGLSPDHIKIETTNTTRVANTSPTAASAAADLNGKAVQIACNVLKQRLYENAATHLKCKVEDIFIANDMVHVGKESDVITWKKMIDNAFLDRVCLTENGHYSTPVIHFDKSIEKGHPFAYHVYGTAFTTVTVDCIRGTYAFDAVKIVHDFGKSMNEMVDRGQIEGGVVQGIGWMTMEDLKYDDEGQLKSNSLSTYKIPDIYSVPKEITIEHLDTAGHELAIFKSKAVGEPPLMYGIGAYFAIQNAIRAFNPSYKRRYDAPFTHEKVLMALYEK